MPSLPPRLTLLLIDMPQYVELSDLEGQIPPQFLLQALDDDGDGVMDAWPVVQAAAAEDVDALLEGRFPVPLTMTPLPRIIRMAARTFACELCYRRRGVADADNPWKGRADAVRKQLEKITAGDLQLSVQPPPPDPAPAGSIVVFDSALGSPGRILG